MDTLRAIAVVASAFIVSIAQALAFDASPQWLRTLEFEGLSAETVSDPIADTPSWASLPDGDTVLATRGDDTTLLLRRIAPDGGIRHTARSFVAHLDRDTTRFVVRSEANSGDIVVMIGSNTRCLVRRYDRDFALRWEIDLTDDSVLPQCVDLALPGDGSAITLHRQRLARIGMDGQLAWSIADGDDGYRLVAAAMAIGIDGTIWVVARGHLVAQGADSVSVQRFTSTGERLPADVIACTGCSSMIPGDIDVTTNGEVVAVGTGGSPMTAFFGRYAADGTRLAYVERVGYGYRRLAIDDVGSIHVLAVVPDAPGEVHRLDPAGEILWSQPAYDLVAADAGVVVTRIVDVTRIEAVRLDAAGSMQWRTELLSNFDHPNVLSRGFRTGPRVAWLIQGDRTITADCNVAPRLAFASIASGAMLEREFCTRPFESRIVALDAVGGTGSLAVTEHHATAFDADGTPLWQAETCPLCRPHAAGSSIWVDAVLHEDGSAWLIEAVRESTAVTSPWSLFARRFAPDGTPLHEQTLGSTPFGPGSLVVRRAPNGGIAVLYGVMGEFVVRYTQLDGKAGVIGQGSYPMPDNQNVLRSARVMADGGLAFVSEGVLFCFTGCNPVTVGITRIAADGTLIWHYGFDESTEPPAVALEPDGSASAVLPLPPTYVTHRRTISAAGIVSADVPVPAMVTAAWLQELSPLLDDRQTVVFMNSFAYGIALLDTLGNIIATRAIYPQNQPLVTAGPHGFLTTDFVLREADADLLSAVDLETIARFRFPGSTLPDSSSATYGKWSVPDDGSLYGATTLIDAHGARQLAVARFNVPGSEAERIFADGFD
ncbi:MAG: hypothetical protein J0L88_05480 [Xanthomonadales bacterium]|nr:hypothetical protein [Xanthomonadales bacterium]